MAHPRGIPSEGHQSLTRIATRLVLNRMPIDTPDKDAFLDDLQNDLIDASMKVVDSTYTDVNGDYHFVNLTGNNLEVLQNLATG